MTLQKRRLLMSSYITSQFSYCPLVWIIHNRKLNKKISQIHERALRIVYGDHKTKFLRLLNLDKSVTIHQRNLQYLLIEIYKVFFSFWVFFHEHSRFTGQQERGEGIYLTPLYHFHPLHRHLDIRRVIIAESSPLHIASSRTRTENFWSPSASHLPLSYAPWWICVRDQSDIRYC